jgi:Caspase domain
MKKFVASFVLISLTVCLFAQQRGFKEMNIKIDGKATPLYTQSHALLIGVSDYTEGWSDLPGVSRDMIKLRIALEEQDFQVTIVENPDSKGVKKAFDDFISQYAREFNARLLVYFSGHGYTMKQ